MNGIIRSQYGWSQDISAKSLRGLKQKASAQLTHGCGNLELETEDGEVYIRRFWRNLNNFGWEKWEQVH